MPLCDLKCINIARIADLFHHFWIYELLESSCPHRKRFWLVKNVTQRCTAKGHSVSPHFLHVGDQGDDQSLDHPDSWNREKDDANAVPDGHTCHSEQCFNSLCWIPPTKETVGRRTKPRTPPRVISAKIDVSGVKTKKCQSSCQAWIGTGRNTFVTATTRNDGFQFWYYFVSGHKAICASKFSIHVQSV